MVMDPSAVLAILFDEPERNLFKGDDFPKADVVPAL